MFKVKLKLCPEITSEIFMERTNNQYNLRNHPDFKAPHANRVHHGAENITYHEPKIWDFFPGEIKQKGTRNNFKESIKI